MRPLIWILLIVFPIPSAFAQSDALSVQFVQLILLDEADLAAPDAGLCSTLLVEEGDSVKRGDLLVRLDDTQEQIEVERAATELEIAQMEAKSTIEIEVAKKANGAAVSKLKRSEESRAKYPKSVSEELIEELQFLTEKTKSEIDKAVFDQSLSIKKADLAKHELNAMKNRLDRRRVQSPIDGVIVKVDVNEGEWVETGRSMLRVVRLDRLRVTGFVASKYLPDELVGRDAVFTAIRDGREDYVRNVKIEYVSPEVNPVSGERRLWVDIDNAKGVLFPGMKAKLEIAPLAGN